MKPKYNKSLEIKNLDFSMKIVDLFSKVLIIFPDKNSKALKAFL
jgi:hypothetical protein